MDALLLLAFVYLGFIPFTIGVSSLLSENVSLSKRHPVIAFMFTSLEKAHIPQKNLIITLLATFLFGSLTGIVAAMTDASPPTSPGVSFQGNGMLGFVQMLILCICGGSLMAALQRAWIAFVTIPIVLILAFMLTYFGLAQGVSNL